MTNQPGRQTENSYYLDWPEETAGQQNRYPRWHQPASNICLDFHGDPLKAQLVVFSDGNHHMALKDCLDLFSEQNRDLSHIFYATTPPGPIVKMVKEGGVQMGNLTIGLTPHVFISPPEILDNLVSEGFMSEHVPFVKNQGNVLLVRKGNPKSIFEISDLQRTDVRLFLSNPETEKASYAAYSNSLKALATDQNCQEDFLEDKISTGAVLFGQRIHHREAPQAVAEGSADVTMVFYHLALRYTRIFPDIFDIVPCGGSIEKPEPSPGNVIGQTSMGLVEDGGKWGQKLLSFLRSKQAIQLYEHHGLLSI